MNLKRIAFVALSLVIAAGTAYAQGEVSLDVSGNYASEPAGGFGGTAGVEFGGNVDFGRLGMDVKIENVRSMARAALGYYDWEDSVSGVDISYRRIPLFLGGRFVLPITSPFRVYGDLGLELSFDRRESAPGGVKKSDSDVNIGLRPQVGIIYPLADRATVGAGLAYHLVSDPYLTLGLTVGFSLE